MGKIKNIRFKGKNISYKTIPELSKKLNVSKQQAKSIRDDIESGNTLRYLVRGGNIARYDITKKPLIFREFGIGGVSNKKLTETETKIKNVRFLKQIPEEEDVNLLLRYNFKFIVSNENFVGKNKKNYITEEFNVTSNSLLLENDEVKEAYLIDRYLKDIDSSIIWNTYFNPNAFKLSSNQERILQEQGFNVIVNKFEVISQYSNQLFNITDIGLRELNLNLNNLYNEVIYDNQKNCVYNYLSSIYPKFSKKKLKELKTVNDIYNYAKDNQIKLIAYDINGNVIKSNYPTKRNKSRKNLIFIAYNEHLYPLKNSILHKVKLPKKYNIIVKENLDKEIIKFLNEGELPTNIYWYNSNISSFRCGEDYYIDNPEYYDAKDVLKLFGLEDKMTLFTNLNNVGEKIEQLYLKKNIESFFPEDIKYKKGGFNYFNEDYDAEEKDYIIDSVDKNKSYPYALTTLDFLIQVDLRTVNYRKGVDVEEIIDKNLYVVKPSLSSLLLPDTNIYSGEHLIYCMEEGLDFEILEELECNKVENFYKEMVYDLYNKVDSRKFKQIMNILIGKMEVKRTYFKRRNCVKICNKKEALSFTGFKIPLDDNYSACLDEVDNFKLYNRRPIAIQIKDRSRKIIYDKMKELNLKNEDIIQIKTDCITFKSKDKDFKKFINNEISGWKLEEFKAIRKAPVYDNLDITFKYSKENNSNELYDCYAGCGKTYFIKNSIIPYTKDYLVLTPSHATLKEYKLNNYNCSVIQKYSCKDTVPEETNIIIDEIGMVDRKGWDVIYKCFLLGKKILGFGDFKQLKSVDGNIYNGKGFIDHIFYKKGVLDKNYRNNFSKEYYDKLIYSHDKNFLIKEVEKVCCKIETADVVVAYRNKIRHKYNNKILKLKGFKTKVNEKNGNIEGKIEKGLSVICITNDLRKYDIYNKFSYNIYKVDNNNIYLTEDLIISKDELIKNFNIGYCRTLYSVQGESIKNIYYAPEDLYFIDNRTAYTFISRIKT